MTKQEYFEFAEHWFAEAIDLSKKKNADYTGGGDDPFANFTASERFGISTETGFFVRMLDKMQRISSFIQKGTLEVKEESVTDTLRDLSNYCALFAGYLESKKEKKEVKPYTPPNLRNFRQVQPGEGITTEYWD